VNDFISKAALHIASHHKGIQSNFHLMLFILRLFRFSFIDPKSVMCLLNFFNVRYSSV
jgi:hypothetical protein